jgi:cytochrome c heme-lyase
MFYNALARKNKLGDTKETEIDSVVALHNNMNEKTWTRVQEWESVVHHRAEKATPPPKLLKFMGRPTDLSPKAMFKHYVLGHPLPYDRHDWTIVRSDGTTVRYVIDYYYDESRARDDAASAKPQLHDTTATPSLLVDVRPAIDHPIHVWYRAITMPLAQLLHKTSYEYLPLRPTTAMKSQVQESVSVWASIQEAVTAGKKKKNEEVEFPKLVSKQEAETLVQDMTRAIKACPQQQKQLNACQTDDDCAKASLDYTLCLSKTLCPIQYQAFTKALSSSSSDEQQTEEAHIEAALEVVQTCVVHKTAQRKQAQTEFGL